MYPKFINGKSIDAIYYIVLPDIPITIIQSSSSPDRDERELKVKETGSNSIKSCTFINFI